MTLALAEGGADIISIELPDDANSAELERQIKGLGRTVTRIHCDVKDSKDLRAAFGRIWESKVQVDILLNCAGVLVISRKPMALDDLRIIQASRGVVMRRSSTMIPLTMFSQSI